MKNRTTAIRISIATVVQVTTMGVIMEVSVEVGIVTMMKTTTVVGEVEQVEMVEQVIIVITTTEETVGTLLTEHVNLELHAEIYIQKYANHGLNMETVKTADVNWHIQKDAECLTNKEYVTETTAGTYNQNGC